MFIYRDPKRKFLRLLFGSSDDRYISCNGEISSGLHKGSVPRPAPTTVSFLCDINKGTLALLGTVGTYPAPEILGPFDRFRYYFNVTIFGRTRQYRIITRGKSVC